MKVVPYGTIGIGAFVNFSGVLGMSLEAGYTLYLESSLIVMGFVPALTLHYRL